MIPPPDPRRRLRRATFAALAANIGIVFTGGLVRVTGSGLGCPTWPSCDGERVVPSPDADHAGWHTALEFGNRLLTFVVLAAVVWAFVEVRRTRPHPPTVDRLAWALPIGVLAQAVLGGITVRMELSPLTVAAHFLLSMVLIALAVGLHDRASQSSVATDHDARAPQDTATDVPAVIRRLTTALAVAAAVLLVLGTVVTGAGPHAGDPGTPRLGVDIRTVARLHASAMWVTIALLLATIAATWRSGPPRLRRALLALVAVVAVQGTIGYAQYALGVPAELVAAHILGAALFWTAIATVWIRARPLPNAAPAGTTAASDVTDAGHEDRPAPTRP